MADAGPPGNRKPTAVVLSSDAIGLGAVRGLHRGGIPTIVVALDRSEPVCHSRYGRKIVVPESHDVEAGLLDVLARIELPTPPVLIPTSDFLAHFVARHRDRLGSRFRYAIPSTAVMELVLDKSKDTATLGGFGLSLPRTVQQLPASPKDLIREVGLPLIIKPRTYRDKRDLGWRNVVAHSAAHVADFYRTQGHAFGRVVAQELIPGEDTDLWECIGVFDRNSDLVSAFTFRKLRTMPPHYGQTSHGRSEKSAAIVELVGHLGKQLRYVGPADVDLKYDARDGSYKYLELNPRLGMCHYFGTRCGVNLVADAYRVTCGEPVNPAVQRDGLLFFAALEDMGSRLSAGDSMVRVMFETLVTMCRNPVGAYFAWDDVRPGPAAVVRIGRRFLQRARQGRLASVLTKDYGADRAVAAK